MKYDCDISKNLLDRCQEKEDGKYDDLIECQKKCYTDKECATIEKLSQNISSNNLINIIQPSIKKITKDIKDFPRLKYKNEFYDAKIMDFKYIRYLYQLATTRNAFNPFIMNLLNENNGIILDDIVIKIDGDDISVKSRIAESSIKSTLIDKMINEKKYFGMSNVSIDYNSGVGHRILAFFKNSSIIPGSTNKKFQIFVYDPSFSQNNKGLRILLKFLEDKITEFINNGELSFSKEDVEYINLTSLYGLQNWEVPNLSDVHYNITFVTMYIDAFIASAKRFIKDSMNIIKFIDFKKIIKDLIEENNNTPSFQELIIDIMNNAKNKYFATIYFIVYRSLKQKYINKYCFTTDNLLIFDVLINDLIYELTDEVVIYIINKLNFDFLKESQIKNIDELINKIYDYFSKLFEEYDKYDSIIRTVDKNIEKNFEAIKMEVTTLRNKLHDINLEIDNAIFGHLKMDQFSGLCALWCLYTVCHIIINPIINSYDIIRYDFFQTSNSLKMKSIFQYYIKKNFDQKIESNEIISVEEDIDYLIKNKEKIINNANNPIIHELRYKLYIKITNFLFINILYNYNYFHGLDKYFPKFSFLQYIILNIDDVSHTIYNMLPTSSVFMKEDIVDNDILLGILQDLTINDISIKDPAFSKTIDIIKFIMSYSSSVNNKYYHKYYKYKNKYYKLANKI